MAVAFDASSVGGEYSAVTGSPKAWTHTPAGTPRGAVVLITHEGTASDAVTSVTYGGVAMTRVPTNGFAVDSAVELGAAYAYFLGSGLPTGPQTVSIVHDTGIFGLRHAVCATVTAGGDTEVVASGKVEGDAANPSISLDSGAKVALKLFALFSGRDTIGDVTNPGGITRIEAAQFTSVARCRVTGYRTTPGTGSESVSQTAGSDDVAMVGLAVAEADAPAPAGTRSLMLLGVGR